MKIFLIRYSIYAAVCVVVVFWIASKMALQGQLIFLFLLLAWPLALYAAKFVGLWIRKTGK